MTENYCKASSQIFGHETQTAHIVYIKLHFSRLHTHFIARDSIIY